MLTLLIGEDWIANRDAVLKRICDDVSKEMDNRILIVPELISHDMERRLCAAAGNTVCRFAEVLPFTRLVRRVSDYVSTALPQCLDNGGRIVAMASAARQLHSKLKAYAAVESNPEFLEELVSAIDEFKQCCITPGDLDFASKQSEGVFAQKLEELSLLYSTYDGICAQSKRDPADQMTWLLQEMEDSDFAENHTFYVDGFPDFTSQHINVLKHLILNSPNITVSLNCDKPDTRDMRFEKAGKTARILYRIAADNNIPVTIVNLAHRNHPLFDVTKHIYQGNVERIKNEGLQVIKTQSVFDECVAVAEQIQDLVRQGNRYRDMGIVCGNVSAYENELSWVFHRAGIPIYLSGNEDILEKSVIYTVLSALDAALGGLAQGEVMRYLKSVLSPMDVSTCDKVENYAFTWNIRGKEWMQGWTKHPDGLGGNWADQTYRELKELNEKKDEALAPLFRLREGFRNAVNVRQQVESIYSFLVDIRLEQRMDAVAEKMEASGDSRGAQMLTQLWEILISALEQLYDVLGDTVWDADTFSRLLKLLLSQYNVGTIPTVIDAVTAGPVSGMRCQQVKYLFVMGVQEGEFPQYISDKGVLSDSERSALRTMGVPLTGSTVDSIQNEFGEIYGALTGADCKLFVSCNSGQPSFLYRRLALMAGGERVYDGEMGVAGISALDASAYLLRKGKEDIADALGLSTTKMELSDCAAHELGSIEFDTVKKLYGTELKLSASQVDKLADCRLSYFLNYGLKAKERKRAEVDPAEFGTYVHAVLEQTGREVMTRGGFKEVSLEDTLKIAGAASEEYAKTRFSDVDSKRLNYLFSRNRKELDMVVKEVWEELKESEFVPVAFEVAFENGGKQEAITITGKRLSAKLRGFVDRVDAWKEDGHCYFRVVDYKTGKKTFDYCDVLNGLGLQMLLYLFALEDSNSALLGENPIPVGVQYFPARAPMIPAESAPDAQTAMALRLGYWKRQGLLLDDERILEAMRAEEKMGYTRKKDGTLSGDIADRDHFKLLKAYVFALLSKMVDEIASGYIAPNPYTRGTSHNACRFCPYDEICHCANVEGRRNFATVKSSAFWDEIEKEMNYRG